MRAHVSFNSILREMERRPSQTLPVCPSYAEREKSECGKRGYSRHPLSNRLASWVENIPLTVNVGHGNSDVIFFTISVNHGKVGLTLTATFRIVMRTYPMEISFFPSSLRQLVCYYQMINDMVFVKNFHWRTGMGQQPCSKAEKGSRPNLHLYMNQC